MMNQWHNAELPCSASAVIIRGLWGVTGAWDSQNTLNEYLRITGSASTPRDPSYSYISSSSSPLPSPPSSSFSFSSPSSSSYSFFFSSSSFCLFLCVPQLEERGVGEGKGEEGGGSLTGEIFAFVIRFVCLFLCVLVWLVGFVLDVVKLRSLFDMISFRWCSCCCYKCSLSIQIVFSQYLDRVRHQVDFFQCAR